MTTANQRRMLVHARDGKSINPLEVVGWHTEWRIDKFHGVPDNYQEPEKWARWKRDWEHGLIKPNDVYENAGNLLMTVGATDLWNGIVTTGLATPWNATNCGIGIGDNNATALASQTDLSAASGSTITTSGLSAATNATPIVITNGSGNWTVTPVVGQVFVIATVNGNTAANGTFEISAATATTATLLNSAGNGAFSASASATVKLINRYLQIVNGAPTVSTNQVQFVSVFASANANHAWNEFATVLGQAATNKQAAPPTKMLNRAAPGGGMGTKASGAAWTITEAITLA